MNYPTTVAIPLRKRNGIMYDTNMEPDAHYSRPALMHEDTHRYQVLRALFFCITSASLPKSFHGMSRRSIANVGCLRSIGNQPTCFTYTHTSNLPFHLASNRTQLRPTCPRILRPLPSSKAHPHRDLQLSDTSH